MNEKESLIIQLIKENPFVSQIELSEKTGLSRSAVAGYISSLTKEGKILGRAYILPDHKEVLCVGGANVDRKIQALGKLELGTSNPAKSGQSCGGVARNIAENLGRLGSKTALLTVVGEDKEGEWLLDYTKAYVDISPSQPLSKATTGTYTAVLDNHGEMAVALADMFIYDLIDEDFIEKKWAYFASSEMIVLDTNFSAPVLKRIIERCHIEQIPLCITPVSSPKVKKLPQNLNGVTWLIANRDEAEALSNVKINDEIDLYKAAKIIMEKGVQNLVITLGEKGLIYYTQSGNFGEVSPPNIKIEDVTGAGDSLVSGIIFAHLNGLETEEACKIGVTCSALTLQSNQTVNPKLNQRNLQEAYNQYFTY